MSKLTLDEAIKHCEEVAWENDRKAMCVEEAYQTTEQQNCEQCAAEHRQLAEWLRELKGLREEYAYINKVSYGYYKELKEAKRLLKVAVEDINSYVDCYEAHCDECCCTQDNHCHWKHEEAALKLIGETHDEP